MLLSNKRKVHRKYPRNNYIIDKLGSNAWTIKYSKHLNSNSLLASINCYLDVLLAESAKPSVEGLLPRPDVDCVGDEVSFLM